MAVSLIVKLIGNTTQFSQALNSAKKTMISSVGRMQSGWASISPAIKKVTIATIGLGAASVKMAANYQKGIAEITTLMGEVAPEAVRKMSDEIKELSIQSGQALDKLTKARYDIVSAGFADAVESAKLLEQSTRTAIAGVTDVAVAADLLTTSLNAYELSVDDAAAVSDTLFTTVRLGKTTMSELASVMGRAIPIAAAAGVSLEELSASIAVLTARGQSTHEAVTAMRASIVELIKPSENLQKIYDAIGISSGNALIQQEGFAGALKKIEIKAKELNIPLQDVFSNIRAMQGAMPLASDASEELASAMDEMKNSAGATNEAYKIMADTFDFQLNQVMQSFKVIMVDIGTAILPEVKKGFDELQKNLPEIKEKILGIAEGFKNVIEWTLRHGDMAATLIKVAIGIKAVGIALSIYKIGAGAAQAAAGILKFGTALTSFAALPVAALLITVGGMIAVGNKSLKETRERAEENLDLLNEHANRVAENIKNKATEIENASVVVIKGSLIDWLQNNAEKQGETAGNEYVDAFMQAVLEGKSTIKSPGFEPSQRPAIRGDIEYPDIAPPEPPEWDISQWFPAEEMLELNEQINEDIKNQDLAMYQRRGEYAASFYENTVLAQQEASLAINTIYADNIDFQIMKIEEQAEVFRQMKLNEVDIAKWAEDAKINIVKDSLIEQNVLYKSFSAGYDQFINTLTDAEMTGKERKEKVWEATKNAFVRFVGELVKEYIISLIARQIAEKASQTAAVASAMVTGKMLAEAYRPAAIYAATASFGGAAAAGLAGITASMAATKAMESFAEGGDFITSGPQIIMVGDNPGGKERVQVTPLSSPNISGPQGERTNIYNINIYAQDAKSFEEFLNTTGRQPVIKFIQNATRRREL